MYCTALYLYSSLSWLSGVLRPDFIINTFCAARWLRQSNTNQEGLEINKLPSASVFIYHSFSQRATPGQKSVWNFQSVLSLAAGITVVELSLTIKQLASYKNCQAEPGCGGGGGGSN